MAEQQLRLPIQVDELLTKLGQVISQLGKAEQSSKDWGKSQQNATAKAIDSTDEMQKAVSEVNKKIKEADKTTETYGDELEKLEKLYKSLTAEQKKYVKGGKDLGELKKQLKIVGDRIKEVNKEQEKLNGGNSIVSFGKNLTKIFSAFMALEIVGRIKDIALEMFNAVKETDALRRSVSRLTDTSDDQLDVNTSRIIALSKTFNAEFDEILRAANSVSKNMEISFGDALDGIEIGLLRGANANGEYLDSLNEYPKFAKEAGLSLDQLNQALIRQAQSGVYADKGADLIKESFLSLRDFTKTQEDALTGAFGEKYTVELKRQLDDREITYFQATQNIVEKMKSVELTGSQVGAIYAGIFKGAGEDAQRFVENLDSLDGQLEDLNETQQKYLDQQEATLRNNEKIAAANVEIANIFGGLAVVIENAFLQAKGLAAVGFIEIINTIKDALGPAINRIFESFSKLVSIFNTAENASNLLNGTWGLFINVIEILGNGISRIIDIVNLVVESFIYLYEEVGVVKTAVDSLAEGISKLYSLFAGLPKVIEGATSVSQLIFNQFIEAVSESIRLISNSFDALLEFDFERASNNASAIKEQFAKIGEGASDEFNKAFIDNLEIEVKAAEAITDNDQEPASAGGNGSAGVTPEQIKAAEARAKAEIKAAEKRKAELLKIEESLLKELASLQNQIEQTEISNLDDGEEKFNRIKEVNEREIAALEANIKAQQELLLSEGQITTEKALELEQQRNSLIAALRTENNREYLEQLKEFNEAENEVFKTKLEESQQKELDLIDSENELQQSRVKAAEDYLDEEGKVTAEGRAKLLELDLDYLETKILFYEQLDKFEKDALGLNEGEIETLTNNLRAQIAAVKGEINNLDGDDGGNGGGFNLLELFGIDGDEEQAAVNEIAGIFGGLISESIDNQLKESEKLIEAIDKEIEAQEDKLENHKELEEEGLAFDLENEEERLTELEAQREKALKQQEKAAKKKQALDAVQQISSLITTGANLFESLSVLPLGTGVIAAIGLIGTMYSAFNAFKKTAISDIPKFRHGTASVQGGIEGQDSVLAYLMPKEAVLPVHIATQNKLLVQGLLQDDKSKIKKGVEDLEEYYNLTPNISYQVPTFSTPDFTHTVQAHQSIKRQIEEQVTVRLATEIAKEQNKQLERIAGNTSDLVRQGERKTYVVPERGTIVEKTNNIVNKIKVGPDKTKTEELLEMILKQLMSNG